MRNARRIFAVIAFLFATGAMATAPGTNGNIYIGMANGGQIGWTTAGGDRHAIPPPSGCNCVYREPAGGPNGMIAAIRQTFGGGPDSELVIMNDTGTVLRSLGSGFNGRAAHPAWSPNGQQIAFEDTDLLNNFGISVINADGTNLHMVFFGMSFEPEWSPSGTQITFTNSDMPVDSGTHISILTLSTGTVTDVTPGGGTDRSPTWSPDGTQIGFNSGGQITKINVNGTGRTTLASSAAQSSRASWSPDGTQIAAGAYGEGGIALIDVNTGAVTYVPNSPDSDSDPKWSSSTQSVTTSIQVSNIVVTEGDSGFTPATFTVTLSTASAQTVSVDYETQDGDPAANGARAGFDYVALAHNTLTFNPGETSKTIVVNIIGETLYEADEYFTLVLSNPLHATLTTTQATCTILNDDVPPVVSIDDVSITEGNSGTVTAYLRVRLSTDSGQKVTVNVDTADGPLAVANVDYVPVHTQLTFLQRQGAFSGETDKELQVQIIGNTLPQPNRDFYVVLSTPSGATLGKSRGTITITDDDGYLNTPTGSGVTVQPRDPNTGAKPVTLTFSQVTQAGSTTLTESSTGPASPAGFEIGNPPTYYDVSTDAVFSGSITVCIDYSAQTLTGPPVLLHYDKSVGAWVDATLINDPVNKKICGVVTSLSPFAVHSRKNRPPTALCHSVTRTAGASCDAIVTAADVDNGSSDPDGDPITLGIAPAGPFGVGQTPVTLTVTDSHGASSTCNATVTVVDTTPPTIACPLPITTEFMSAAGAPVAFVSTATDNCGAATVVSAPPSGSTFPIGITTVNSVATDTSGNKSSCAFTVTVLGPSGVIQDAVSDLTSVRATVTDARTRDALDAIIAALNESLQPKYWLNATHLQATTGGVVFVSGTGAVAGLQLLLNTNATLPAASLQNDINRIVKSARLLAETAVDDAIASHAPQDRIVRAQQALAFGDTQASAGRFAIAVAAYGQAWALVVLR